MLVVAMSSALTTTESLPDVRLKQYMDTEREVLRRLYDVTVLYEHAEEARRLRDILDNLEDLFLLVIAGEFNSGKSSFINALLGQKIRVEGPIPVDDRVTIMRYADKPEEKTVSAFVTEQRLPVEFLRTVAIVDTPGTNSVIRQHQQITEDFIPRADLILFITSIDRPLTESERQFLAYIQHWRKKVIFVLNKVDLKEEDEIARVMEYLDDNCRALLGFTPQVFPVSAKLALSAKLGSHPRDWSRSRFEPMEDYIFHRLNEQERVRLKLLSPIDTAATVADTLAEEERAKARLLTEDTEKITRLENQLQETRKEMQSNFEKFILQVDKLVLELRDRGVDFLGEYVRLRHIHLLRNETAFRQEFERKVLADWQRQLDSSLDESVDWLVRQNMRLWNDTLDYFNTQVRRSDYDARVIGSIGGHFVYERDQVRARIQREAERRIKALDYREECRRVIGSAMGAIGQSFGLGAGAVGLGYILATAFSTVVLDVTGVAAATLLFTASFFILPYKRKRAVDEFRSKTERLREELRKSFEAESNNEINRAVDNVREAIAPYIRFVRAERAKVEEGLNTLNNINQQLAVLRQEIMSVTSATEA